MKTATTFFLALALALASTTVLHAASGKCTVIAVEGTRVILDCGDQAAEFPVGSAVKIKSEKGKAIEGC